MIESKRKLSSDTTVKTGGALVMIDVINPMNFDGGEQLLRHAWPAACKVAKLQERVRGAGIPVIYVNDNFGDWCSDFRKQIEYCSQSNQPGHRVAKLLSPKEGDYFILKPKHSGFYCTPLEILLGYLGVKWLILTGFAGNLCVLYTAYDAYMRDYQLYVPADCIASESAKWNEQVLEQMQRDLKADISESELLQFSKMGME